MGRRYRYVLGTAVVVTVLAAAGCGGGGGGEAASPSTTTGPSPTSEPTSPSSAPTDEAAVLAAYQGYWDTWLAANDPPNPDHPDLERYATGAALDRDRAAIGNHRSLRQVIRLPKRASWRHSPTIDALAQNEAVLTDCSVDDSMLIDEPSGRVLNDAIATYRLRAVVARGVDGWRVTSVDAIEKWEGVAPCAG